MVKKLLILYYSGSGNTKVMAEEIFKGASGGGVFVEVKRVEDCEFNDLIEADGVITGSPTYFSNVAWQMKKIIDESIVLYRKNRQLGGKVGGCFTSSGSYRDGKECIRMMELAFGLHHKLEMVPGIIRVSGDTTEKTSNICQQYGKNVVKKLISV